MLRKTLHVWDAEVSDMEARTRLVRPRLAEPELGADGLLGATVPFLLVLEAVKRLGWRESKAGDQCVVTTTAHAGVFSLSKLGQNVKPYFQRILALSSLFAKGLERFVHTAPASYYSLLLRSEHPNNVDVTLPADKHDEALATCGPPVHAPAASVQWGHSRPVDDAWAAVPLALLAVWGW